MALPLPTSHLIVTQFGKTLEVEVFRCDTDGGIVYQIPGRSSQAQFKAHAGHKLKQPVIFRKDEIDEIMGDISFE